MTDLMLFGLLVVAQNASFTLVSRARNSSSLAYHTAAAVLSNGVWLLVFRQMVMKIESTPMMVVYLFASVLGSVLMHALSMKFIEKGKRKIGSQ